MDVRIGTLEATITDTGDGGLDDAQLETIARRVAALIERKTRSEARSAADCRIASPDEDDLERYG